MLYCCSNISLQSKLDNLTPVLTWSDIWAKVQQRPHLFQACVWPALLSCGWRISTAQVHLSTSLPPSTAPAQPSVSSSHLSSAGSSVPSTVASHATPAVFMPPPAVANAWHASTGQSAGACNSVLKVMHVLSCTQQPIPAQCAQLLQNNQAEDCIADLLAASGQANAPHRVCADPSGPLAGACNALRPVVSNRI